MSPDLLPPYLLAQGDHCLLVIRVVPRAGRTGLAGTRGDALLVRLAAAPVDGAANDALLAFLSEVFGVPRRDLRLRSGERSRDKTIEVPVSAPEAADRLQRWQAAHGQGKTSV